MQNIKKWQPEILSSRPSSSGNGVESYSWKTVQDALFKSVAKNDEYSVSQLILAGADMNACNKYGMTALMVAAEHNAKDVASLLIKAGADLEAVNNLGLNALQIAAGSDSIDVAEELIQAGAYVNAKTPDGESALSIAIENKAHEIMILLLAAGARPDFEKKKEERVSASLGIFDGKEDKNGKEGKNGFCEKGSDNGNISDSEKDDDDGNDVHNDGNSKNGNRTDSKKDVDGSDGRNGDNGGNDGDGGDNSSGDGDGDDENPNLKILSYLPGPIAKNAPTPKNLVGTLYGGHGGDCLAMETSFTKESKPTGVSKAEPGKSVRIFKNLDPFINGDVGLPIDEASVFIDYAKYKKSEQEDKKPARKDKKEDYDTDVSQFYKEAKVNHEHEEIKKRYSWIQAAKENDLHIANLLTVAGADINEKDMYGQTALMYAVSQDLQKGVQLLLKAGADVNLKNARDETVLMRAAFKNLPDMLSLLIQNGANINDKDISDWTALMYASKRGSKQCIDILLRAGADVNAKNKKGETAAQIARKRG